MKVYIVFKSEEYYCEEYGIDRDDIERVFDSEDKAIKFIQGKLSEAIGMEDCIIDEVPGKEYLKNEAYGWGIKYMKNKHVFYRYRYEVKEVY